MITNKNNISEEMAVWLVFNDYDRIDRENYISATALMKPLRHIILPARVPPEKRTPTDVEDLISSSMGSALHAGIEKAWLDGRHKRALQLLGYPQNVIDRVLVNPTPEQLAAVQDPIPVYVEQRAFREVTVNGYTYEVGGKFDMVIVGRVTDTKSTSVWTWMKEGHDEDYRLQGSIYRWLNPDKVTEDHIRINFIFTDWNKLDATVKTDQGYPPRRVMHKDIPLLSLEETEAWIRAKLTQLQRYAGTPEPLLPECSEKELWMSAPKYKFYSDPTKLTGRSTKNFDSLVEANLFKAEKGKGVVVTVPGAPKRCGFCAAYNICTQKDRYLTND